MDHAWKSELDRGTMAYLRPNPFYMGLVRMLLSENKVGSLLRVCRNADRL